MIGTLIFNIIAVFFAWLESAKIYKHGLKAALFTVFLFLALRYNFGNDYMGYFDGFYSLNSDVDSFYYKGIEVGWLYLSILFLPFGFFTLQFFLAAFTTIVIYKFVRKYVPNKYYWFAVFVYVFSPYQMLVLSSAIRQSIAGIFFLFAIDFIVNKKFIWYLFFIFLATLFHSSAGFLYPLVILPYINWKISFPYLVMISLIFFSAILYAKELFETIQYLILLYFDIYQTYASDGDFIMDVGIGFVLIILMNLLIFFYMQNDSSATNNLLYKIVIISFLMIPLEFSAQILSRLNFYLNPVIMAVYPIVFMRIKNSFIRVGFISIFLLFTLYTFWGFFQSPVWESSFRTYKTIFSAPIFY